MLRQKPSERLLRVVPLALLACTGCTLLFGDGGDGGGAMDAGPQVDSSIATSDASGGTSWQSFVLTEFSSAAETSRLEAVSSADGFTVLAEQGSQLLSVNVPASFDEISNQVLGSRLLDVSRPLVGGIPLLTDDVETVFGESGLSSNFATPAAVAGNVDNFVIFGTVPANGGDKHSLFPCSELDCAFPAGLEFDNVSDADVAPLGGSWAVVLTDGTTTTLFHPNPSASCPLPADRSLVAGDETVGVVLTLSNLSTEVSFKRLTPALANQGDCGQGMDAPFAGVATGPVALSATLTPGRFVAAIVTARGIEVIGVAISSDLARPTVVPIGLIPDQLPEHVAIVGHRDEMNTGKALVVWPSGDTLLGAIDDVNF